MAKKRNAKPKTEVKKIPLKEYVLRGPFPPYKTGEKIKLSEGGAELLKSKNLI